MVKLGAVRNLGHQVVQELGQPIVSGELEAGKSLPHEDILASA